MDLSDSGKCFIKTLASEDISGTEAHARSLLRAWLDSWVVGEGQKDFVARHPEAAGKMTMDVTRADLTSRGQRLVRYEVTSSVPTPKGYRFTVTAVIEDRGTPETKILYYEVFKDRVLSEGRWTISGT